MLLNYKAADFQIKDVDTKQGITMGFLSGFDNKDADKEIMRYGAFRKSIQENGPQSKQCRIIHLVDHSDRVGNFKVLEEQKNQGLYYEAQIGKHAKGRDYLEMVESGIITEHSIGYVVVKSRFLKEEDATEILEVKLYEGSGLTKWGANSNTPFLGVKSEKEVISLLDTLTKALRNGTYSDETFLLIEEKHKALTEAIKAKHTNQPPSCTDPDAAALLLKTIKESFAGLSN